MSSVPRLPPAMDCDTIDQAQRTQLPSEVVQPAGTDSVPQQGECSQHCPLVIGG